MFLKTKPLGLLRLVLKHFVRFACLLTLAWVCSTSPQALADSPTPASTYHVYLPLVMKPVPDIQPSFPIRATFYYPWFPEAWDQNNTYPYTNYTPSLGLYNSSDPTLIQQHLAAMRYAGIQVGIASWWGPGTLKDTRIPMLLQATAGTNFRWALYYEEEGQSNPTVNHITSDLIYIRDHYGRDPS